MKDRLLSLVAVNRAILGSLDYDEALRLVVDRTAQFTGADTCILLLVDEHEVVRIAASQGLDPARALSFSCDFDERIDANLRELLGVPHDDHFIAAPVIARERVRGLLVVHHRDMRRDPSEEIFVRALADQAAGALLHASYFREAERIQRRKSRIIEAIQSHTATYLAYLDPDLRLLEANAAYCRAIGVLPRALEGRHYAEIVAPDDPTLKMLQTVCRTHERSELHEVPRRVDRASRGTATCWDYAAHPVLDASGSLEGIVLSAVDVTAKVEARRELEQSHRRKDEFLAMLAHELRNPLAAIASAVEILRVPGSPTEHAARSSATAQRQIVHVRRLLDDLLDVARVTTGKITLRREPVDLRAIVTQAIHARADLLARRQHRLSEQLPERPVFIEGDPDRLLQIVGNLVTNAAKYTGNGGRIEVCLDTVGDAARVRVRDDGFGIPPDMLPLIFEPFVQVDRPLDRATGGVGLGLTIAHRLVSMHGGRIEARSAGLGCGSELEVRLPLAAADHAMELDGPEACALPVRRRHILIAEDNEDAAEMLAMVLEIDGHRVSTVADGLAAVEAVLQRRPDVLLLDLGLPSIDGYEVVRRLRRELGDAMPLVAAVSGYGSAEDRRKTKALGVQHHLVKPVPAEELRRIIASAPRTRPSSAPSRVAVVPVQPPVTC